MQGLKDVSLGLWIDDPPKVVLEPDYIQQIVDCNIDCVAVMIDRMDRKWQSIWTAQQLEKLLKLLDYFCIDVVLTTWPYPDKLQIDAMAKDIEVLLSVGPISGWEADLEFNWKSSKVRGFHAMVLGATRKGALDLAGDYFVERAKETCAKTDARFEITTFSQHTENGSKADVAPHADTLIVQCYSATPRKRRNPNTGKLENWQVPWGHLYGPGRMQRFSLERTLTIPGIEDGKPDLGCGLAAFGQRFHGHTPEEAMYVALEEAVRLGVVDVRWWSSKHVIGVKKNPYAALFLQSLRKWRV